MSRRTEVKHRVEPVDLTDADTWRRVNELMHLAFGEFDASLQRHILKDSHPQSLVLGIYSGGELMAVNGFVAHSVHRDGVAGLAFQSCMSATHPSFGGRGAFTSIIDSAKQYLADAGGAFIFGYPNGVSGPIFLNRLGFQKCPLEVAYVSKWTLGKTRLAGIDGRSLSEGLASRATETVLFDARATCRWKQGAGLGNEYVEATHLTNYVFGKVAHRRVGPLRVRVVHLGGYEINKPQVFASLLGSLAQQAGASVVRLLAPAGTPLLQAAWRARETEATEPLIVYPLNWEVAPGDVDAWVGLKDVF